MKTTVRALLCLFVLAPLAGLAQDKKKYKILFLTQSKGFAHGSVTRKGGALAPAEVSMTEIGKASGLFDVECTQDASVLTPEKLKELDAVMFYTTGALPISPEHFAAFQDWLKSGKAFIGTHSATDTFGNFKPYYELINGTFNGHPWGGDTVTFTNHDPEHPTVKMLGPEFQWKDEIYQYVHYDPKAVRVLYSINMAKTKLRMPYHVPVCWVREVGNGRLFYTNLGHSESTWANAKFKDHLLAGIRWALKLEEGSATPNPEVQALENTRSLVAATAAETGKKDDEIAAIVGKISSDETVREKVLAEIAVYRKDIAAMQDRFKKEQAEIQKKLGSALAEFK